MLFNSYEFLLGFLPVVLVIFFFLGRDGAVVAAIGFLAAASLFFYGWWNPVYVVLLAGSILFNYGVGRGLLVYRRRALLAFGIAGDVLLLGIFKYAGFVTANLNHLPGVSLPVPQIVLPLGISFFTFTQIAYLVDVYWGRAREYRFLNYALFVTFFPHLLAGPVLHHAEVMPQFAEPRTFRFSAENLAVGLTIFAVGLFKKVILADGVAEFVAPAFDAARDGATLTFLAAWGSALAYTFQIYFDFSGYSDMAIGLARLFGITFPANFNSPYKAASIIEFWRRWHMTLTRFLTDYIYNPLVLALTRRRMAKGLRGFGGRGTTLGAFAQLLAFPTLLTMFISGLWHGAGYTFVLWGLLHGLYLTVNHAWRQVAARIWPDRAAYARIMTPVGIVLTFLAWTVSMVLFRSPTVSAALGMLEGMSGMNGITKADPSYLGAPQLRWLAIMFLIAWGLPNVQQILHRYRPTLETYPGEALPPYWKRLAWSPAPVWALATAFLLVLAVVNLTRVSEFLYYQF